MKKIILLIVSLFVSPAFSDAQNLEPLKAETKGKFMLNEGQWPSEILYQSRVNGNNIYLLKDKVSFAYEWQPESNHVDEDGRMKDAAHMFDDVEFQVWNLDFLNANKNTIVSCTETSPSKINFLLGNDKSKWVVGAKQTKKVNYKNLYNNIDLEYLIVGGNLKYNVTVNSDGNIDDIHFQYSGVENISINEKGQLVIKTAIQEYIDETPFSFQMINGEKKVVNVKYKLLEDNSFGFEAIGNYDKKYPLIIDPFSLLWGTFLGVPNSVSVFYLQNMCLDSDMNYLFTGETNTNFPTTVGAYSTTNAGNRDAFVTKLDSSGTTLIYSTYIGGTNTDKAFVIDVNANDEAVVGGNSESFNFPTVAGCYTTTKISGGYDGVSFVLSYSGDALVASTFFGIVAGNTNPFGLGVASNCDIYLGGNVYGAGFPTTPGAFQTVYGGSLNDCYIIAFDPGLTAIQYCTYIGGSSFEELSNLELDYKDNVYFTGRANSADFPVTPGAFQTVKALSDDIIACKMDKTLSTMVYATFVGGSQNDYGINVAISNDKLYVSGNAGTAFPTFPTGTAIQSAYNGGIFDGIAFRVNTIGSALDWSTYLGSGGGSFNNDITFAIEANSQDEAYCLTACDDNSFAPGITAGAFQGNSEVNVCHINSTGTAIGSAGSIWMTVNGEEYYQRAVLVEEQNTDFLYCGLRTNGTNRFTTPGKYFPTKVGSHYDMAAWKLSEPKATPLTTPLTNFLLLSNDTTICAGDSVLMNLTTNYYPIVWTPSTGVSNPSIANPYLSPIVTTTYQVKAGTCFADSAQITITVGSPAISVTNDTTICMGDTVVLSTTGTGPFSWTPTGSLDNPSSATPKAFPSVTTMYYITVGSGLCVATDSVTITVNTLPTVDAGPDQTVCDGDTVILTGSGASTYTWDNGVTDGVSFTPPLGTMTFTVTGTDANGCENTGQLDVTVNSIDDASFTYTSGTYCISAADPTPAVTGTPGGVFTASNAVVIDTADGTIDLDASGVGTYMVYYTTAGPCPDVDSVEVAVGQPPPALAISGPGQLCMGSSITLTVQGPGPYMWSTGDTLASITVSPAANTSYWVQSTNNCGTSSDTSDIAVIPPPVLQVSDDTTITFGASTTLSASGASSYLWSTGTVFNNINVSPEQSTTYTVTGTDSLGCSTADSVTVTVLPEEYMVYVPNVFTINSSNSENKRLYVFGRGIESLELIIYDRWGEKVHETSDARPSTRSDGMCCAYGEGWDGTYDNDGKQLNTSVFAYKLKGVFSNGEDFFESGNITLIR